MNTQNPNCCGARCTKEKGEVRILPIGGGGNLTLCRACFKHEMSYRRTAYRNPELPDWHSLKLYDDGSNNAHIRELYPTCKPGEWHKSKEWDLHKAIHAAAPKGLKADTDQMAGSIYIWSPLARDEELTLWATPFFTDCDETAEDLRKVPVEIDCEGKQEQTFITVEWTGDVSKDAELYWTALQPFITKLLHQSFGIGENNGRV